MIRGTKRALEKRPSIKANINASIHNRFDIEVVDAKTGEVKQKAQAENVICNPLWQYALATSSDYRQYFKYIQYGSGTGTPSESDTQLFSLAGALSASSLTTAWDRENGVVSVQKKAQMLETVAVGVNITEIGVAAGTGAGSLCTHAMLKDMNGNQISILKTDADIINISATMFLHYSTEGYDGGAIKYMPDFTNHSIMESGSNIFAMMLGISKYPASSCYCMSGGGVSTPVSYNTVNKSITWTFYPAEKRISGKMNRLTASENSFVEYTNSTTGELVRLDFLRVYICNGSSGNTDPEILCEVTDNGTWFTGSTITSESVATGDGVTKDFRTKFGYITECEVLVDGAPASGVSVDLNRSIVKASQSGDIITVVDENGKPSWGASLYTGKTRIFENLAYQTTKIIGIYGSSIAGSWVSNDLVNWTSTGMRFDSNSSLLVAVPKAYQQYRYFKVQGNYYGGVGPFVAEGTDDNIHFDTPPAAGSVITANYHTKSIAKDENHVFDFELSIQFGEYTED